MGFGDKYKHQVELLCNKYEISGPLRKYFISLSKTDDRKYLENRKQVITGVYSGDTLNNAIKCLEEIMKI